MSLQILGTGSTLGSKVVTNDELAAFLDTSDEWISTRTGIKERHLMGEESVTDMAAKAAELALENAGVKAEELDYILCTTLGGDYISPSLACMVQARIGATCPALDINNGCSGFLYGLDVASRFLERGDIKRILMISAEGLTRMADWTDRSTCVLFGDGAGAMVLAPGEDLLYIEVTAQGWADPLYIPFPQGNYPGKGPEPGAYLKMDGQEIYKFAVNAVSGGLLKALDKTQMQQEDIDYLLLHQANLRIIDAARRKLKLPKEKVPTNIHKTGNMSAATIPVLLDECNRAGMFKPGDILFLGGFGAGLTTGTAVLRWSRS